MINEVKDLQARFDEKAEQLYEDAKNAVDYRATRYLQKVRRDGRVQAAKDWLRRGSQEESPTAGFQKLAKLRRLDLSLEALVIQDAWSRLFTEDELAVARERLAAHPCSRSIHQAPRRPYHMLWYVSSLLFRVPNADAVPGNGMPDLMR